MTMFTDPRPEIKRSLKRLLLRLIFWFQDSQRPIIMILLVAFCVALLLQGPGTRSFLVQKAKDLLAYFFGNAQTLVPFSEAIRNVVTAAAVIFAGIWTYYVFIKGRTFKPRASVAITLIDLCGSHKQIAIIRIKIKNEGRTRIRPLSAPAEFYYGILDDHGQVQFVKFLAMENILGKSYDPGEICFLEPQDEFSIDLAILWGSALVDICREPLMLIKVLFVDARMNAWREQSIVSLQQEEA